MPRRSSRRAGPRKSKSKPARPAARRQSRSARAANYAGQGWLKNAKKAVGDPQAVAGMVKQVQGFANTGLANQVKGVAKGLANNQLKQMKGAADQLQNVGSVATMLIKSPEARQVGRQMLSSNFAQKQGRAYNAQMKQNKAARQQMSYYYGDLAVYYAKMASLYTGGKQ
jgi:hypothetical protein